MRTRAATLAVAAGLLVALQAAVPAPAAAQQRDPLQTIGETVADRAHAHYRFERFTVSSADGTRTWRVDLGIPAGDAPATGWPSFWMLDGNGALIEFDEALLDELATRPDPHALVFIGYDNDLRIDSPARTRDYTFAADLRGTVDGDPQRVGGGADALLEVIERQIRPELVQRAPLDPQQQTLWGHSLAGLFVLHTLYTRAGLFQTYAAGSPSLWWGDGGMLREPEEYFIAHNAGRRARVLLSLGGGERARDVSNRDLSSARVVEHLRRITAAPPDAAATLAERLRQVPGLSVEYREFDGLTHGPMFRASLMDALHKVTGVADRSGTPRPGTEPGAPQ
ncbi:alpha/beta hydrolase [Luteimonas sp. BDR2-5]|uniref:alpha/beta hydrolase n=1 Tax=Proluteimonas luteida TaxID=2878685 RepID=UPI001E2C6413|nr:alpha/beta hydrolase-fold protein [Luteimonas sp. BDR2-5]MCD9028295.1 alpha/beta hydrolase [Luteimonas sp. BDR2-5]